MFFFAKFYFIRKKDHLEYSLKSKNILYFRKILFMLPEKKQFEFKTIISRILTVFLKESFGMTLTEKQ